MTILGPDEPMAQTVVTAIHEGDHAALRALLAEHPELVRAWIGPRSLLHVATDWPGDFPHADGTVALLIEAGADVNARFAGGPDTHNETPLHWAASGDNLAVLDVLIDAGAEIDAPGAVIARGTPLSDAVAFGQWHAARRLIERGATPSRREAAAMGLMEQVEEAWGGDDPPTTEETTEAFWYACHGGQLEAAEYLLDRGADFNWVSTWDQLTPLDAAVRSEATALADWLRRLGADARA